MEASKDEQQVRVGPLLDFLKQMFNLKAGDQNLWLVGGSVRDTLLGKEIKDLDLVTTLTAKELENLGFRAVQGVSTGPIWFKHSNEFGNIEITVVEAEGALAIDLKRRDFTLNALLMTLDGEIVDPLAGRADLEAGILNPCNVRTFLDDPLRIFRALRFETEGFTLSSEGVALIRCRDWEDDLSKIPVERFSREMLKALKGGRPDIFFRRMIELNVGSNYLPELFRMPDIPAGPLKYHPEGDLFSHCTEVLERVSVASDLPLARFCGFFHDLGKLSTEPQYYPKHHGHDKAGFMAAEAFCRRLALPAEYGGALGWISRLHANANRLEELRPSTRIRMAEQALRAGISEILPIVSAADKPVEESSGDWQGLLEVAQMNLMQLGISQEMIESMQPSKRSAYILQKKVEVLKSSSEATF